MKKSKEKFADWRDSVGNHKDRKHLNYLKESGADKEQINHILGTEIQRWK